MPQSKPTFYGIINTASAGGDTGRCNIIVFDEQGNEVDQGTVIGPIRRGTLQGHYPGIKSYLQTSGTRVTIEARKKIEQSLYEARCANPVGADRYYCIYEAHASKGPDQKQWYLIFDSNGREIARGTSPGISCSFSKTYPNARFFACPCCRPSEVVYDRIIAAFQSARRELPEDPAPIVRQS